MGEWGQAGSHEVAGKGYIKTENSPMASTDTSFTSRSHTKQLNSWPNTSAGGVVNYSQLSACQGEMESFEDHASTRGLLTSLSNEPQQRATAQAT